MKLIRYIYMKALFHQCGEGWLGFKKTRSFFGGKGHLLKLWEFHNTNFKDQSSFWTFTIMLL